MSELDPAPHRKVEADTWARENGRLLDACFEAFAVDGEWPRIEALEHRFEVEGAEIDIGRLVWEIPRPLAFVEQGRLVLLCRALLSVEAATALLDGWFATIRHAYESWLEAPDDEMNSHKVVAVLGGDETKARQVSRLLLRESWRFGSGTGAASGYWTREIISAVKIVRDAHDAAGLIEARSRQEAGVHRDAPAANVAAAPAKADDRDAGDIACRG